MKCPRCGADARVLQTRSKDDGHRTERRMECFNTHRFTTIEIHQPVYCSARQRQRTYLRTLSRRIALHGRRREMVKRRAAGDSLGSIARDLRVSKSLVHLVCAGKL